MKFGEALLAPACFATCLLFQACVEYIPENAGPGQPPGAPQYGESPSTPPAPPVAPPPINATESGLDALLAPIALYPDPLVAIILPASTAPADIAAASAYLVQYADPTQVDSQPWDASVRALAHYPAVLTWMADNMAWTQALGAAFVASPSDVMASVQRLRGRAMESGALAPSQQVQVASEDGEIEIIPTRPDVICVPVYDPDSVFSDGPYAGPPIYYGPVYPAGIWLSYYVDWHHRSVWDAGRHGDRGPGGWHDPRRDGGRPPEGAKPWRSPSSPHEGTVPRGSSVPHPRPMPMAPNPPGPRGSTTPAVPQRGEPRPQPATAVPPSSGRAPQPEGLRGSAPQSRPEPARPQAPAAQPEAAHRQAQANTVPPDPRDREQPH